MVTPTAIPGLVLMLIFEVILGLISPLSDRRSVTKALVGFVVRADREAGMHDQSFVEVFEPDL